MFQWCDIVMKNNLRCSDKCILSSLILFNFKIYFKTITKQVIQLILIMLVFAFGWYLCGRKPECPEETRMPDLVTTWPSHMPTQRWEASALPLRQPDIICHYRLLYYIFVPLYSSNQSISIKQIWYVCYTRSQCQTCVGQCLLKAYTSFILNTSM